MRYSLVPNNDRSNLYAAGIDGNLFASYQEAQEAITSLCDAFNDQSPNEWVVVEVTAI